MTVPTLLIVFAFLAVSVVDSVYEMRLVSNELEKGLKEGIEQAKKLNSLASRKTNPNPTPHETK